MRGHAATSKRQEVVQSLSLVLEKWVFLCDRTLGDAWTQLKKSLHDEAEVHLKFSNKVPASTGSCARRISISISVSLSLSLLFKGPGEDPV